MPGFWNIWPLFFRMCYGNGLHYVIKMIVDMLVIAVLLSIGMLLPLLYYLGVGPVQFASYDYRVAIAGMNALDEMDRNEHISRRFIIGPMYEDVAIEAKGNVVMCELRICDSFQDIDISVYNNSMTVDSTGSENLLADDAICIGLDVAEALNATVGDEIILDGKANYTIARIYEATGNSVQPSVLVQYNSRCEQFDPRMQFDVVNEAYLCSSDRLKTEEELLRYKRLYEEPDNLLEEDSVVGICDYKTRAEDVDQRSKDVFSLGVVVVSSLASLIAFMLFLVHLVGSCTRDISKETRLFQILGMRRAVQARAVELCLLARVLPSLACASLVTKEIVYPLLTPVLLSWKFEMGFVLVWCVAIILCVIATVRYAFWRTYASPSVKSSSNHCG